MLWRYAHPFVSDRQEDVPAEGQTVSQRAARLFKTCDDVVTQDTDYVPRLRGYMRDANLHWPEHPETRDPASVDVVSTMLHLNDKWNWPGLLRFTTERLTNSRFEVSEAVGVISFYVVKMWNEVMQKDVRCA